MSDPEGDPRLASATEAYFYINGMQLKLRELFAFAAKADDPSREPRLEVAGRVGWHELFASASECHAICERIADSLREQMVKELDRELGGKDQSRVNTSE